MVIPLANQVPVAINARLGVNINSDLAGLAVLIDHGNAVAHGAERVGDGHGDALREGGWVNGANVVVAFDDDRAVDLDENRACIFMLAILVVEEFEVGGWPGCNVLGLVVRWGWNIHLARSKSKVACECAGSEATWTVVVGGSHDSVVWVRGSWNGRKSLLEVIVVIVVVCVVWIGIVWVNGHWVEVG